MEEKAFAKLNISLDVSKAREDGYHDMTMVMQDIDLCDTVSIRLRDDNIKISRSNFKHLPCDEKNLAVKAVNLYLNEINENTGFEIYINKEIPVGAGMAGGSSDAAAALRAMNRLYENRLTTDELLKIAEKVGSDVPYCLLGGTMLAEGKGEILTQLKQMPDCLFLVCKPEFSISTPEFFKALDRCKVRNHPDTKGILEALEDGNLRDICRRMYNVFEDIDDRRLRVVSQIKAEMVDAGALGAIMTGTGSAVFGVFECGSELEQIKEKLKKEYGFAVIAKKAAV